jgi:hypothetical protein
MKEVNVKGVNFLVATILLVAVVGVAMPASAADGMNDSHGVWHDAAYWHGRHPEWVYRYHPEWAVDHEDWWMADHRYHPEWFEYPYWRRYPVWTWGADDRNHVWRGYGWWHENDPGWFYAHHPEWAEAHPYWIRDDHFRHPDWFHNAYWTEHPHDWAHPEEAYRTELYRDVEQDHAHPQSYTSQERNYQPGGTGDANHTTVGAQYHPTNQYHPTTTAYHPPTTTHSTVSYSSTVHSTSSGKH